jgi:hypothetical protein
MYTLLLEIFLHGKLSSIVVMMMTMMMIAKIIIIIIINKVTLHEDNFHPITGHESPEVE